MLLSSFQSHAYADAAKRSSSESVSSASQLPTRYHNYMLQTIKLQRKDRQKERDKL